MDDGKLLLKTAGAVVVPAAATGGSVALDFSSSASTCYGMGQNRPAVGPTGLHGAYDTRSLSVLNQTFDFKVSMTTMEVTAIVPRVTPTALLRLTSTARTTHAFDFKRTMGNEGGATNAAPFTICGGQVRGNTPLL